MKLSLNRKELGKYWGDPEYLLRFFEMMSLVSLALIVNYYAVRYATSHAGSVVPDIILDKVKGFDTSIVHNKVTLYVQYLSIIFVFLNPRFLIFYGKASAVLILVRCLFINLTNLGIPHNNSSSIQSFFTQGGDLFFSGHTALPFMAALIFWEVKLVRYVFLLLTIMMGLQVLLGHLHYSIDVFAAPFITYGVFVVSKKIFKDSYDIISK